MSLLAMSLMNRIVYPQGLEWALFWITKWRARSRWRRSITRLTERDFADLGMLPVQAWRESQKPFWLA